MGINRITVKILSFVPCVEQSFLGLASYYCRFVMDFAIIASPPHRQEPPLLLG